MDYNRDIYGTIMGLPVFYGTIIGMAFNWLYMEHYRTIMDVEWEIELSEI